MDQLGQSAAAGSTPPPLEKILCPLCGGVLGSASPVLNLRNLYHCRPCNKWVVISIPAALVEAAAERLVEAAAKDTAATIACRP